MKSQPTKLSEIFRGLIKRLISKLSPNLLKRMLSISILTHKYKYPKSFKGKSHFNKSDVKDGQHIRENLWDFSCKEIGNESVITFIEFGVFKGRSMRYFLKNFTNKNNIFIGLDTFEGLPEDWETTGQPKGSYSNKGKIPDIEDERLIFYKGLFQNTFEKWSKHISSDDNKILICHFDADIYSATLFGLTKIGAINKPFYCIFDEFFGDECRALEDFKNSYLFESSLIASGPNSFNSFGRVTNRCCLFKISPSLKP